MHSFRVYNGKDKICVVSLDDKDNCASYLKGFVTNGAQLMKLSDVPIASHGIADTVTIPDEEQQGIKDSGDGDEHMGFDLRMIENLQKRWRYVLARIHECRHQRETPDGQILLSVQNLCATELDKAPKTGDPVKLKIHIRAFLLTEGAKVLIEVDKISRDIQALRDIWKFAIGQEVSVSELEELDTIIQQIVPFESKLATLTETWSIKGFERLIPVTSPETWKSKSREALRMLKSIRHEMDAIARKLSVAEVGK